jgi:hypothetical protein
MNSFSLIFFLSSSIIIGAMEPKQESPPKKIISELCWVLRVKLTVPQSFPYLGWWWQANNNTVRAEHVLAAIKESNIKQWSVAYSWEDKLFLHLQGSRQDLIQKLKDKQWFDENNLEGDATTRLAKSVNN